MIYMKKAIIIGLLVLVLVWVAYSTWGINYHNPLDIIPTHIHSICDSTGTVVTGVDKYSNRWAFTPTELHTHTEVDDQVLVLCWYTETDEPNAYLLNVTGLFRWVTQY